MFELKSALQILRKNIGSSILIVMLLLVTVFITNSLIGFFMNISRQVRTTANVETNLLYFMQENPGDSETEYDSPLIEKIYKVHTVNGIINTNQFAEIETFDSSLFSTFTFPLARGRWFTNDETEYLEVVVSSDLNYSINSIINVGLQCREEYLTVKAKVVGILPNEYLKFNLKSSSLTMNLDHLFSWGDTPDEENIPLIYCNESILNEKVLSSTKWGNFIQLQKEISSSAYDDVVLHFSRFGMTVPVVEMRNNSIVLLQKNLMVGLPVVILAVVISTLSFLLMTILVINKMKYYFTVLYLNGAKQKTINGIITIYCLFISIIVFVLNLVLSKFSLNPFNNKIIGINDTYNIISLLFVTITFFTIPIIFLQHTFKKNSLVNDLKKGGK